jgi:hypothetical protein
MEKFQDVEPDIPEIPGDYVALWEFERSVCGKLLPNNWQFTGSCVNGGGYNALKARIGVEIANLGQPESYKLPFTLIAYGQSRYMAFRDTSEGEGSSGDAMAKALQSVGVVDVDDPGVPRPVICGPAICYDRATELKFSSIRNHPPEVLERCKKHTLSYVEVTSADQGVKELRRGRPMTFAGNWGGVMKCPVKGTPAVLLMPHSDEWNHQQSVHAFWFHPTLGLIFYVLNNWYRPGPDMKVEMTRNGQIIRVTQAGTAISSHGESLNGEPPGGYWILAKDFEYQCRTGEVRSLKGFTGFAGGIDLSRI